MGRDGAWEIGEEIRSGKRRVTSSARGMSHSFGPVDKRFMATLLRIRERSRHASRRGDHGEPRIVQTEQMARVEREVAVLTDADRVSLWLMTNEGAAALMSTLRRFGLQGSFDSDLVKMVIHAADLMVDKGQSIESIPAWTKSALRLRAMDLLRSPGSQRAYHGIDDDSTTGRSLTQPRGSVEHNDIAQLLTGMAVADIRRHVGAQWGTTQSWRISASLTYLSISVDGCAAGTACPAPVGGAGELDAAHWAGLHYAGQHECFAAHGQPDSNTIRQRRKRKIDDVRSLLQESYRATHQEVDHG